MTVKCCRTYEEVHEGDVGKVVKLDRDELHDLNVQVDWQRKGGTYWVRYIHIELLTNPSSSSGNANLNSRGDQQRIKVSCLFTFFVDMFFVYMFFVYIFCLQISGWGSCPSQAIRYNSSI